MLVDLLYLCRNLRRSPGSTAAAILTLTLTLGSGASIFAVVHAVLLTPPPFEDPDALVVVGETPTADRTAPPRRPSYSTFEGWRQRSGSLATLEAYDGTNVTLTELGVPERLSVTDVTPGFLTLLGVAPSRGRGLTAEDTGRPVAIVSYDFWRGKLAGDADAVGREIVLGGQAHTVIGVLPESFRFELDPSDVWRPLVTSANARARYPVQVVARLAPGVPRGSLEAALDDVSRTASPPAYAATIPITTAISGDATKTLGLLTAAAALAIAIAFTNFAGILIVRSMGRRRELAIRSALGARGAEIAKQLLVEALALAAVGTAGGVLLALWATPVVARLALEQFGGVAHREVTVSWQVIGFVALAASACACLCALAPARTTSRQNVADVLRGGATPGVRELVSRRVLVVGQVALAFVLIACVTLVGGSLLRLLRMNPGFDARGVLALQVSVPALNYTDERARSFYATLQTELEGRLEPRSVAIINEIPLTGDTGRSIVSLRAGDLGLEAVVREAGPGYVEVMRIPVAAGRFFDSRDDMSVPLRAVISQSLAKRLFAAEQPIGHRIWLAARAQVAEVVGVVGDVKHRALDETALPTVYLSALQSSSYSRIVVVRSARPDSDVVAAAREEVSRLDRDLPVYRVRSMEDVIARSPGVPARRLLTAVFMGFALLALVLGAVGLFGVVAHDVASRRAELALRLALGADPARILGATFAHGAVMVGAGLAIGGVISIGVARALSGAGLPIGHLDVLSLGAPAAVLTLASAAAVLPAARRAAGTDPLVALRSE